LKKNETWLLETPWDPRKERREENKQRCTAAAEKLKELNSFLRRKSENSFLNFFTKKG
jgi:hypothetical protein